MQHEFNDQLMKAKTVFILYLAFCGFFERADYDFEFP
jgi:hypothetical protein